MNKKNRVKIDLNEAIEEFNRKPYRPKSKCFICYEDACEGHNTIPRPD